MKKWYLTVSNLSVTITSEEDHLTDNEVDDLVRRGLGDVEYGSDPQLYTVADGIDWAIVDSEDF